MSEQSIEQIIIDRIKAELDPVEITLRDMTGTKDHWEALIISNQFEGMRLISRQQKVYQALGELMLGPIHAFTMQTLTPTEAEARGLKVSEEPNTSSADAQNTSGLLTLK